MTAPPRPPPAWPLLEAKDHGAPSLFRPAELLRDARRQKGLAEAPVPSVCMLDPDGDIVRQLERTGAARPSPSWACYHTRLLEFGLGGRTVGIVGCAVGAPFAVLVAEQLFASGCRFLLSVTSAGQIVPAGPTPYFVVIDRALRDEGTSCHYLPPAEYAAADAGLVQGTQAALAAAALPAHCGASWTTDAPYRETALAIEAARARGILAVEMEAAGLYAFAAASGLPVLCLAYVTNSVGRTDGNFEKGEADGSTLALAVAEAVINACTAGC